MISSFVFSQSIPVLAHGDPTDPLVGDIEVGNTNISGWRYFLQSIDGYEYANKHLGINSIRYKFDGIEAEKYRSEVEGGAFIWGTNPFSSQTLSLTENIMEVFNTYRLRDEQEKYFQQMKDQMVSDRQRTWSEEGKTGRLFILFVSLILSSYVRYIWKSTRLHELLSTSLEILDEMRSIRLIEHHNHPRVITPFVGAQIDICTEFDIEIPEGCAPAYILQKKPERKRGRPPKKL